MTSALNEGAWPAKFIFVGSCFIFTYFIPDEFFRLYGIVATIASLIFLLYEMILIIDLAYSWNKSWTDQYSASESGNWAIILIVTTVIFYSIGIIACIYWLMSDIEWWKMCNILATISFAILCAFITANGFVINGSIFTCAIMFGANMLICGSLTAKTPGSETWICLILLFIVLIYISSVTVDKKEGKDVIKNLSAQVMETKDEYDAIDHEDSNPEVTMATGLYHLLMTFASMYYAMLLTNWGGFTKGNEDFSSEMCGIRARFITQWAANGLFLWSLVAPRIFPDRDFS